MAKQISNSQNIDPISSEIQPEKPRRARSAASPRRREAQTSTEVEIPATTEETFTARSEADDRQPSEAPAFRGTHATSMGSSPSEEDIRVRAYHRYLERGGHDGLDFEDWLEAERELKTLKNN